MKKLPMIGLTALTAMTLVAGNYIYKSTDFGKKLRRGTTPKSLYVFDPGSDSVLNKTMQIRGYGSESYKYDRAQDAWARKRVARFLPQDIKNKSVMDFGCNQGNILFMCKEAGAQAITGIEHNSFCVEQAQQRIQDDHIANAQFVCSDIENTALYRALPQADTVLILAVLDTSENAFGNKASIIANLSRLAKNALYYEGHKRPESHVKRMYEFLVYSDFTRFEYLGKDEQGRPLMRCGREMINEREVPAGAVTSDSPESEQLNAEEIYVYTDAKANPAFSKKCRLIQYVTRAN